MSAPFEIVGSPLTLYLAPIGTPMPAIDDDEASFDSDWFKVGTSGDKNYSEENGVVVNHEETLNVFRGAGSTLPRKAFRTEEDFWVQVTLADLSPEQYAKVLNDRSVATTAPAAGVAGEKRFSLYKGPVVETFALLARGLSSVDDSLNAQYEVASVYPAGNKAITFTKGNPALLVCEFRTIDADGTGEGIEHAIQTAPAT
jgi:hypothetical protein